MRGRHFHNEFGRIWRNPTGRGGYQPTQNEPPKIKLPKGASPTVPVPRRSSNTTSSGAGFRALSEILRFLNQPLRVSLLWVAAAASFLGFFGCVALVALFVMWFDFGSAAVFSVGACLLAFCAFVIVCGWLPRG
jgi:hypothetical protein